MNGPLLHRVTVWDWPTRAFHWLLAALIAFAWWSYETDRMAWHRTAGYAVLALIAFRLFWGVFGSQTARFANFLRGPRAIVRYLAGRAEFPVGHNPLGALSVVALLAVTGALTVSGLFAVDDDGLEPGPLADTINFARAQRAEHWHGILFDVLLALVAAHLLAILFYFVRGDNLVRPMIDGTKLVPVQAQAPRQASLLLRIVGIGVAGATFAGLLWLDRG